MEDFPLPKAVRFGLYILGALTGIFAAWATGKPWFDDSDTAALFAVSVLLNSLAAVNSIPHRKGEVGDPHDVDFPDE